MSEPIANGQWPSNRTGEVYELNTNKDTKCLVSPSSVVSIDLYQVTDWEFVPWEDKRTFLQRLLAINTYPKVYKGKKVYFVGYFGTIPAIDAGKKSMMRLNLINGKEIVSELDQNFLNHFMHR